MSAHDDRALQTLFLPFANGDLAWPDVGGALFLGSDAILALRLAESGMGRRYES